VPEVKALRIAARVLGGVALAVPALVLAIVAALQVDPVGTAVFNRMVPLLAPAAWDLRAGRVSGSWLGGLVVEDVRLARVADTVALDTVRLDWSLLDWRIGRIVLEEAEVGGVRARLHLPGDAGSATDTASADGSPPPSPRARATGGAGGSVWTVRLERVALRRGDAAIHLADGNGGVQRVPYRLTGMSLRGRAVEISPALRADSLTVQADFAPPGRREGWGVARLSARYRSRTLTLDTLSLRSPGSEVAGGGRIAFDDLLRPGGLQWELHATPLVLAEIAGSGFLPPGLSGDTVELSTSAHPGEEGTRVRLDARTSGGDVVGAEALWSREGDEWAGHGSVTLEARGDTGIPGLNVLGGPLRARIDGEFRGAVGDATRPGTEEPGLQGTARIEVGSVRALLRGGFTVAEGEGPPGAGDSLALVLDTLVWDRVALTEGRITAARSAVADGDDEGWGWTLDARPAGGGRVEGRGSLTPAGPEEPLRYSARLGLVNVVEPYSDSRVTGGLRVDGRGRSLSGSRGEARVTLDESRVGGVSVDTVDLDLLWDAGDAGIQGSLGTALGGGSIHLTLSTSKEGGRFELRRADIDSLVVRGSGPDGSPDGPPEPEPSPSPDEPDALPPDRVRATVRGAGSWTGGPAGFTDLAGVTARLEMDGAAARIAGVRVDSVRLSARLRRGRVEADLHTAFPDGGRATVRGRGGLLETRHFTVEEGRFTRLDAAEVVEGAPATRLDGSVTGRYRAEPARIEADLRLDPSLVLGDTVQSAEGWIDWSGDTLAGRLEAHLGGGSLQGRLGGTGIARLPGGTSESRPDSTSPAVAQDPAWTASLEGDLPGIGGFLGRADSAAAIRFVANARDGPRGSTLSVRVLEARGPGLRLDTALFAGRLVGGLLVVDTLRLRADRIRGGGAGTLPLGLFTGSPGDSLSPPDSGSHRLALRLEISDSARAPGVGDSDSYDSDFRARAGSLRVATRCDPGRCRVDGEVALASVLFRDNSVAAVEAAWEADVGPGLEVSGGDGTLELTGIRTPTAAVREADVMAEVREGLWDVEANALIDDARDARLKAEVDPGPGWVRIRDFIFRMDEDLWRLRAPGIVRYGGTGVGTDTLEIVAGEQRLLVGGRWTSPAGNDLRVEMDSVRVGTVSDLLGAPGLDGWVDARIRLRGAPGELRIGGTASGELTHGGEPLHRFEFEADPRPAALNLRLAVLDPGDRERLRLSGDVPVDGDDSQWDLDVEADSLPLAWIEPYLPANLARDLAGELRGEIRVEGSRTDPVASGDLALDSARIGLPAAGITLRETRLRATLDGRTLTLDTLRARSVGTATATGEIRLPAPSDPTRLDLGLEADGFIALNNSAIRTVVDGEVRVGGTGRRPEVTGDLRIPEAVFRLDEAVLGSDADDVTLSETDWRILQTRFGILPPDDRAASSSLFQAAALDLSVELGRDLWVRQAANPELQIQFTGAFTARKESGTGAMELQGELEGIPQRSYVEQFGRRFELEEGAAQLRGAVEDTRLEITSEYDVPPREGTSSEVTIGLTLEGEPGDLGLTLSSTPSMENADIVSYLATGRPASQAFGSGGDGGSSAAAVGAELLAARLTSAVEEFALQSVGLDVLEIRREGLREATLVAGQYVTPELFLGFRQPVAFGSDEASGPSPEDVEAQLEWQAYRWLLLHLETGGSAFRFFLQGSYGY
jgi:translocation and assembly module TamB